MHPWRQTGDTRQGRPAPQGGRPVTPDREDLRTSGEADHYGTAERPAQHRPADRWQDPAKPVPQKAIRIPAEVQNFMSDDDEFEFEFTELGRRRSINANGILHK